MPKNLRDFIKLLEKKAPGELLWGEKLVVSKFEVTAVLRKLELDNRFPMVIFREINPPRSPGQDPMGGLPFSAEGQGLTTHLIPDKVFRHTHPSFETFLMQQAG